MAKNTKKVNRNKRTVSMTKSRKSKSRNIIVRKGFSTQRLIIVGICFAVVGSILLYIAHAAGKLSPLSLQTPAAEGSGMVASRQYPGVFWWHRDGGGGTTAKPREAIYALKFDAAGVPQPVRGTDKTPYFLVNGSSNTNWEDIALDDQNNLWIGDIGANKCGRNDQKLLKVKEPNPTGTETLSILASYTFKFPDPASGCNTWNSEAMFWLDGKMYIFAKTDKSPVYRVDLPSGTSGTASLTRIGVLGGGVSNISASSLSDDRSRLMVAGHANMNMYKTTNTSLQGDALVKDIISRAPAYSVGFDCGCAKKPNVEGASFRRDSYDVAFIAENTSIYYAKPSAYGDTVTPEPTGDTTPPTVSITSPVSNATVSGIITIGINASDNVGITRVNVYYDGANVIREGTSQGTYGWGSLFDTRTISDGVHTFNVIAYDGVNNSKTAQVSVTVKNAVGDTTAPSVSITSPLSGATVSGNVIIRVTATDNVAVTRVDIFYDGTKVIREGLAQGTYGWGSLFNTTKATNGTHLIKAVGYDAVGNNMTAQISVNIQN